MVVVVVAVGVFGRRLERVVARVAGAGALTGRVLLAARVELLEELLKLRLLGARQLTVGAGVLQL